MTDERKREQIEARRAAFQASAMLQLLADPTPEVWHYLSFADGKRAGGSQFLGGAYVRGATLEAAIARSHMLGINPGGEVRSWGPMPTTMLDDADVRDDDRERLLTREELER